jgi:hypothetical protein
MNGASVNEGINEQPAGRPVLDNMRVIQKMKRPGEQMIQANREARDFEDKFNTIAGKSKESQAWHNKNRIDG